MERGLVENFHFKNTECDISDDQSGVPPGYVRLNGWRRAPIDTSEPKVLTAQGYIGTTWHKEIYFDEFGNPKFVSDSQYNPDEAVDDIMNVTKGMMR